MYIYILNIGMNKKNLVIIMFVILVRVYNELY